LPPRPASGTMAAADAGGTGAASRTGVNMIYELRIYHVMPGRMDDINRRFREHTMKLFAKHGIKVVGFWQTVIGESDELIYITAFDDLNQRQRAMDEFARDPEWLKVKQESEASGVLVARVSNRFLKATDYWTPA
jgi:hypothetical protein